MRQINQLVIELLKHFIRGNVLSLFTTTLQKFSLESYRRSRRLLVLISTGVIVTLRINVLASRIRFTPLRVLEKSRTFPFSSPSPGTFFTNSGEKWRRRKVSSEFKQRLEQLQNASLFIKLIGRSKKRSNFAEELHKGLRKNTRNEY